MNTVTIGDQNTAQTSFIFQLDQFSTCGSARSILRRRWCYLRLVAAAAPRHVRPAGPRSRRPVVVMMALPTPRSCGPRRRVPRRAALGPRPDLLDLLEGLHDLRHGGPALGVARKAAQIRARRPWAAP
uniref:Uncharacterized protein n=1 Tax=Arundo donax TaxID=35708 RepID=A0A0A9H1W5_ARUDO